MPAPFFYSKLNLFSLLNISSKQSSLMSKSEIWRSKMFKNDGVKSIVYNIINEIL